MARKLRIEYGGATYHVMARGNQGRDVYGDDHDRRVWLSTLAEACEKTGWRIHAWVMMRNHYHLLHMGDESRVTHAIRYVQGGQGGAEVAGLKERLERAFLGEIGQQA